jgi:hypothetical protein
MGSTGDQGGEPSLAPRSPVASSPQRGARRKGAPATHDICPARSDLHHAQHQSRFRPAVLLTGKRRRRGDGGAGLRCRVAPARRPEGGALPHLRRPLVAVTAGQACHLFGTAAGGPWWGAGPPAAHTTPHQAPHPKA